MSVEFRDYYETLGIPRTATQAEIKKAFRKLARQNHPDVKPGDAAAEARFKAVNEANEVLSDPGKRKRYDELGAHWDRYGGSPGPGGAGAGADPFGPGGPFAGYARGGAGAGPGGVRYEFRTVGADDPGFSDFFRMFFGGGTAGVSDLDAMGGGAAGGTGTGRRSSGARAAGSGGADGHASGAHGATGRGRAGRLAPVEARVEVSLEEAAAGTTRIVEVDGSRLEVKIPRGVDTGSRVRLRGKGGDGRDLVLVLRVPPHRVFTRTGADLSRDLPVTLREALLGAEVPVATLDGRVLLTIPAGTQNGRTIRLKGKGMPVLSKDDRGDLLVKVRVVLPAALSDEARSAAARFLDLAGQPDPRGG
ncbi:MAG: J domain-containing protein [Chloroflexi bacterium]|nr:J domain-containing protein [Chloroflexota bacterium]